MRVALFWSTIAVASTAAGAAAAADNLKGTYSFVGAQVCLVAPAGFKQDSKGNFTIPIGDTNLSQLTSEGRVIYHGDGTGEAKQTFVTIVPPPNPFGAAVSAGTISYSFTYAPEGDRAYRMAVKPGAFQGMLDAGPNAGQQFSIEGESRLFRVSDDGKKITVAIDKPYVQKITFSGSPTPVPRVCTSISNQVLLDESVDTVGKADNQVDCDCWIRLSVATSAQTLTPAPIPLLAVIEAAVGLGIPEPTAREERWPVMG